MTEPGALPAGGVVTPLILVIEDDRSISALVAKNLEAMGARCREIRDGEAALAEFERLKPALVVLDIGLPGLSGLDVARRIRRESDVPILMLTARGGEADKLLGFEIGADDYLTKPFSTLELVARARALLRRAGGSTREAALRRGDLVIDPARRQVENAGIVVSLTTLEFDLLYFLATHPGRVFSREALMNHVWGLDRVVDDRSIDSVVSRLRRRIEADPANPRYLQTVWGAGYRFADERS